MDNNLNFLSTRSGFNVALRYFKIVNYFITQCKQEEKNLADLINNALENATVKQDQVRLILNVILVDKFGYKAESINIKNVRQGALSAIADEVKDWNLFDFVIAYYHPQLGLVVVNPKNPSSWENVTDGLKENELVVIYTGNNGGMDYNKELAEKASKAMLGLLSGESVKDASIFKDGSSSYTETKTEAKTSNMPSDIKAETGKASKRKLSPKYGIVVQNELFHNGNVEAWKRIIASYENKYPDIKVLVFYDNEEIHDINTLFKWGKVKHGTMIFISLLGEEFNNISKLRRYLSQGASPRFEDFLKGPPHQILSLF